MSRFNHLFQPIQIKNTLFRNRVAMAPMNHNFADPDGRVTDQAVDYYAERAKGGASLIVTSAAVVDRRAKKRPGELCVYADEFIPGLRTLTTAVQAQGAKIFLQLNHIGRELGSGTTLKFSIEPVGPSALPHPLTGEVCHELTIEEIKEIRDLFIDSARRAQEAGFDGVEVHGAHGYLLTQFVHPFSNRRTDEYGGGFEGRIKLPLEIVKGTREATGDNFLIDYRMSGSEFVEDGRLLAHDESISLAKRLSEFVDVLHVSAGSNQTPTMARRTIPLMSTPRGCYAYLAGNIKKAVNIPVMAVGRINTPEIAESILAGGQADMVAIGRGMIADPYWVRKAEAGQEDQIRTCVACNQGCIEYLFQDRQISCLQNATVGHERELAMSSAEEKKKVLIIGGGVGGMEAARVATLRGHRVELWEKTQQLGGNTRLASATPWKSEFREIVDYLVRELRRLEVPVKLGTDGKLSGIMDFKPDVLILATGANPRKLQGFEPGQGRIRLAEEALAGQTGDLVTPVCVIGGGMVGLETACLLAAIGHETTVVEMLSDIGLDMGPINRGFWREKVSEFKITVHKDCQVIGPEGGGLKVTFKGEPGPKILGPYASYVIAVGYQSEDSLKRELEAVGQRVTFPIHSLGDCVSPRNVLQAIREGYRVALSL
jgi:2,4-dienoyl-CoA reductase-like NADH-dependent reductase (Old Yellow Enzyme family)/thioredoxin reductase